MTSKATSQPQKSQDPPIIAPQIEKYVELHFPVWNDNDIKPSDGSELVRHKVSAIKSLVDSEKKYRPSGAFNAEIDHFKDPEVVPMPACVGPTEWLLYSELFPDATITLYNSTTTYSNLVNGSKHLFMSEFMRTFISTIHILEHLSLTMPWPIEGTSENYYPNTANEPWRPWHHIYAMCNAGKGILHRPSVNPYGKYYVRLYWMGSWRKITVDDYLPIDSTFHVLLPSVDVSSPIENFSKVNSSFTKLFTSRELQNLSRKGMKSSMRFVTKRELELWPFILCKAMLKIAGLTWNEAEEVVDFNMIASLTGWVVQKVCTLGQTPDDVWKMCMSYSKNYQWPEEEVKPETVKKEKAEKVEKKGKDKGKTNSKASKSTKDTKNKKRESGIKKESIKLYDVLPSCVVASVSNLRNVQKNSLPNIAPCWDHHFLIKETRNIPFIKPDASAYNLAHWKKFRWVDWAKKNKTFVETDFHNIKFFKIVSNFKLVHDYVKYDQCSRMTIDLKNIIRSTQEYLKEKRGMEDKQEKPEKYNRKSMTSKGLAKEKESSINSKRAITPEPDPSFWVDFNTLTKYIDYLYIFMKPSQFSKIFKVTNIKEFEDPKTPLKTKTSSDIQKEIITIPWQNTLKPSQNEPFYMFLDNIESSYVIVNVNQSGNECFPLYVGENESGNSPSNRENQLNNQCTHIVVESYNWMKRGIGENYLGLSTYGSKSIIVRLHPGRHILRLWIRCLNSLQMFIMCNDPIELGNFETINEAMLTESQTLIKTCYNIGDKFGKLIAAFGKPDFRKCLLDFYSSYMPNVPEKRKLFRIHIDFFKELLTILKAQYGSNRNKYITAIRCLFVNPRGGFPVIEETQTVDDSDSEAMLNQYSFSSSCISNSFASTYVSSAHAQLERIKIMKRSACIIQAFFKRVYVKKLLSYHNPEHLKHGHILEALKTIYKDILNVQARVITFSTIFRNLFFYSDVLDPIKRSYRLYADFNKVVLNHTLTGTVQVYFPGWVLIGRYVFQLKSTVAEVIKICVFCNVDSLFLRVFDNDTYKEIIRYSNFTGVDIYLPNLKGYTVLVYGWVSNTLPLKWKLCFITLKKSANVMIDFGDRKLERYFLTDVYKPNALHQICKCRVAFNMTTSATLRFTCSLKTARIKLIFRDYKGNVNNNILGIGSVILPILDFIVPYNTKYSEPKSSSSSKGRRRRTFDSSIHKGSTMSPKTQSKNSLSEKDSELVTYYNTIEAYVLDDSWPLTAQEWRQVDMVKLQKLTIDPTDNTLVSSKGRPRKLSECRTTLDFDLLPKPYWCLQIFAEEGTLISFLPDLIREETLRVYKDMWNIDPDRYDFAQKMRYQYLLSTYAEETSPSLISSNSELNETASSETVYLTRPAKLLPGLDLTTYCNNEDNLTRSPSTRIKCMENIIQDQFDRTTLMDNFDNRLVDFEDWCEYTVNDIIYRNQKSENWFFNRKLESEQKLAYSDKFREDFIKAATPQNRAPSKDKEKKKGKKKG